MEMETETITEIPTSVKDEFKEWVKIQQSIPPNWKGQNWFRHFGGLPGLDLDICDTLILEAIDEALQAEESRYKVAKSLQVPGFGLPLSFMPSQDERFPVLIGVENLDWNAATLLIREACMLKMIEELTNKNEWWIKVWDSDIAQKWKDEAIQMDWRSYRRNGDFTPDMADACIMELRKKAEFYNKTYLIPIFDYSSCVLKSDTLIPRDLRSALRSAVRSLEDVSDADKDWHPGTTHKVLDLVHPSLWPFIYGRTPVLLDKRINLSEAIDYSGMGTVLQKPMPIETLPLEHRVERNDTFYVPLSHKFQWLPCDVVLNGPSAKIDSYINNLHPVEHGHLYPIIERFIEKALPAWDLTYRWHKEFETQRVKAKEKVNDCMVPEICWGKCEPWRRPLDDGVEEHTPRQYEVGYALSDQGAQDIEWFKLNHRLPEPIPGDESHFRPSPDDVKSEGFFNNASRIQVIVKLANIHLAPEHPDFQIEASKEMADWYNEVSAGNMHLDSESSSFKPTSSEGSPPNSDASTADRRPLSLDLSDYHSVYMGNDPTEYEGGSWHTEGMLNERICATALYYYDSENVTDCHLDFRTLSNRESLGFGDGEMTQVQRVFDIQNIHRDTIQNIGGVLTTNSPSTGDDDTRAVFFPNLLQHRVSPFRLLDPTRPGHRKILALFLVDPAVPIISTANVPPQQLHWSTRQSTIEEGLSKRLPPELANMVLEEMSFEGIDLEEAKRIRLELMEERSVKQDVTEERLRFNEWNFCEH